MNQNITSNIFNMCGYSDRKFLSDKMNEFNVTVEDINNYGYFEFDGTMSLFELADKLLNEFIYRTFFINLDRIVNAIDDDEVSAYISDNVSIYVNYVDSFYDCDDSYIIEYIEDVSIVNGEYQVDELVEYINILI